MTQTMQQPTTTAQMPQQPSYVVSETDKARIAAIAAAWEAYNGLLPPPLKKMPDGTDPNVMSNRCQPIVDRGVDFLFGKEVEISVEEGAPDEAQTLLDTTWGRKETRIPLLQDLAMNGAIAGQAFLRIVPNKDNSVYRLIVVDPSIVSVQTAPQDCETVLLYCIQYSMQEQKDGKPVTVWYHEEMQRIDPDGNSLNDMPDDDDTWTIQHWTRIGDRGNWTPAGEPIVWPYNFAPLFSCKNLPQPNSFWGKPDITPDIIGVNKALNMTQSCINLVQILYGHPVLFATGTGQTEIDIRPGKIIGLPLDNSKIASVPIVSDVANALAFCANLRSDIDEQSSVPGVATGRIEVMPRGISGIAIELMAMPLLKKTEKKQCNYGALLIAVSKALLVLGKMSEDIDIELAWQGSLPSDDLATVQAAILKKQIDISNTTIQRELGYDPEAEQALSQTEDAQKLQAYAQGMGMPPPMQQPGQPMQQGQPAQSPFIGNGGQ